VKQTIRASRGITHKDCESDVQRDNAVKGPDYNMTEVTTPAYQGRTPPEMKFAELLKTPFDIEQLEPQFSPK
jgi:hypothetical protein